MEGLTQDLEKILEMDGYTWQDFYEIRHTENGFEIWSWDMAYEDYITTCDTQEQALEEVQTIFEGFKETMF